MNADCHCPPDSLCPVGMAAWNDIASMDLPPPQAFICCPTPAVTAGPPCAALAPFTNAPNATTVSTNITNSVQGTDCNGGVTNCSFSVCRQYVERDDNITCGPPTAPLTGSACPNYNAIVNGRQAIANNANNASSLCNITTQGEGAFISCMDSANPNDSSAVYCKAVEEYNIQTQTAPTNCGDGDGDGDGGGDGGGDCFAPLTIISLEGGEHKPIEQLIPGDKVIGKFSVNTVKSITTRTWEEIVLYNINDGALTLTADHPMMTSDGWKAIDYNAFYDDAVKKYGLDSVGKLEVGDQIFTQDGSLEILSIQPTRQTNYTTYNIELDGNKTFYANGMVARSN